VAVRISPGEVPERWEVQVPGSKSLTNRALLIAAVAGPGRSILRRPLIADDTEIMAGAVRALGARVQRLATGDWVVHGLGGVPAGNADIWCGMAGTVARFVLPVAAAGHGRFGVDADPQLRARPLGPLLDALRAQGALIDGDALPLTLRADGLSGGKVEIDASVSSQFTSGLLIAAPLANAPTRLSFGELVSRPYVRLTLETMRAFGVSAAQSERTLEIAPGRYRPQDFTVEPDASTASYFLASAALTASTVRLPGLDLERTAQGDADLVHALQRMGAATISRSDGVQLRGPGRLRGIELDMGDSSDVFMTLACIAPFAEGPTTIEGIGHARVKESDRIAATAENLRRVGIDVDEGRDHLRVHPGSPRPATLPTYNDHRIAMAFALIGTRVPVVLEDPAVVAKTCPGFFELWRSSGARVEFLDQAESEQDAAGRREPGAG
jgi:3-phosphoshikimate 1-carboxyvinyltransferase